MRKSPSLLRTCLLALGLCVLAFPAPGAAADQEDVYPGILNAPASISIGGGGTLPAGHAVTALNSSYRHKDEGMLGSDQKNNRNIDNTTLINLLKLRYAVTDRFEVQAVVPYTVYQPTTGRDLDSWGDITPAVMYGFLQEKLGEPFSLAGSLKLAMPTASVGPRDLPGGNAWAGTAALGFTKTFGMFQINHDLYYTAPFEEGNQHVRKGNSYGLTYRYAYALNKGLALALEGTIDHSERGKRLGLEVKNESTEWYTGPAVTWNVPGTTIDLCLGAYLPVYRDYGQNTSSEGVRVDGKFFIFW